MKKFITFEGMDGSGKSTQISLLKKSLKKIKEDFYFTREPGGTIFSEKIRRILVQKMKENIQPKSELLLVYAARHQHVENIILPNLRNQVVVCDRFYHSTFCYQIVPNKVRKELMDYLHKHFAENLLPDITIFLDVKPKISIKRSLKINTKENRFELKNSEYHEKVYKAFKSFEKNKDFYLIDGSMNKKIIHKQIVDILNKIKITKVPIPYFF
tara:strand:- start:471 stop:1109 length:639 start_codon:yes stop_codon:yes gene_type:complete